MPTSFLRGASLHYRVEAADLHAHLFRVTLTIAQPEVQQRVSLPVWIPGSYLIREFSKNLQRLAARQQGRAVAVQQVDKSNWQVDCVPSSPLVLSYEVYAFDNSVRSAWLDTSRGFFNGTSLCLKVHGQESHVHALEIMGSRALGQWQVAVGLGAHKTNKRGFGTYLAADYDELVDCPVELGTFWSADFKAAGIPHRLVVAGAAESFDGARLLADTQKICETEIRFWHDRKRPPFKNYLFMINVVDDGYGGLEHRNSTALIASRRDLPRLGDNRVGDGYTTLLGLISHEYFHTWNVKRLRPAEFARYDYTRENYTGLLWFFEGFTSYYDDLFLLRTGLIDTARYLRLVARAVTGVLAMPGRKVQSLSQSSFDAWVKYYRADENTPNATISYYTKGALVALALDLTLRAEGRGTLDDVMRALWAASGGGPIDEAQIAAVLQQVGGRSYAGELAAWVHGTDDLPLQRLLEAAGVDWRAVAATLAQRLGLRVSESALTGVKVVNVLRGGAGELAGVSAGDEVLAIAGWRVRRLDDALRVLSAVQSAPWLIARDQRVLTLSVMLPTDTVLGAGAIALNVAAAPAKAAAALRKAWLAV